VGALLTRRVRKDQPQSIAQIDLSNKFGSKLAFLSYAGLPYDPVSGTVAAVNNTTLGATSVGLGAKTTGSGKQIEFNLAPLSTSNGIGTGDFTIFAYSDAPAVASNQALYTQKNDALGAPYSQIGLYVNTSDFNSAVAGYLSVSGYSGSSFGAESVGAVDGAMRLYMAVRRAGVFYLYRDGVLLTTVGRGAAATTIYAAGQLTGVGHSAGTGSNPYSRVLPFAGSLNYGMTDSDAAEFFANPWQLFKPKSRRMFAGIAAGGNTAINPGAGTLVITGAAPTVSQSVNQQVNPGAGSLAFTGYAPVILQPQSLTSGTGALVLTGYAPAVTQLAGIAVNPGAGALTLTGYAPAIAQPRAISPSTGALTLTGYAPLITQAVNQQINPAVGNLALTGYAPTLAQSANTQLIPAVGALTILGFAPSISQIVASPNLVPGVGTLTLTGFAPTVGQTNIIAPRYAKPNADTVTGAWVPSTGSSLYAMINETVEDDTTFIKATTATTCDVALNPVANPGTTSGQVVRYSAWSPFGNGLTVSLKQGATVIASWTTAVLPVAPTLFEQNLTAAQIAAISDYGALHLSFASQ
jgi:hypothetical protein